MNVATIFPKEILSRMLNVQSIFLVILTSKHGAERRAKNFIVKEGLLLYRDKYNKEYRVNYIV